jgi:deazaflavin-dependent oxidoreductase (nitroreductase family)
MAETTVFRGMVHRLGRRPWFAVVMRNVGAPAERVLYRLSRGRLAPTGSVAPVMLLTTTGRRTGRRRTTPVIYVRDGEQLIVSSEDVGQSKPAAWPLNLDADPRATVQLGSRVVSCQARRLTEEEADRHWPALLDVWPAHADYLARSGVRHTFVLTPE